MPKEARVSLNSHGNYGRSSNVSFFKIFFLILYIFIFRAIFILKVLQGFFPMLLRTALLHS